LPSDIFAFRLLFFPKGNGRYLRFTAGTQAISARFAVLVHYGWMGKEKTPPKQAKTNRVRATKSVGKRLAPDCLGVFVRPIVVFRPRFGLWVALRRLGGRHWDAFFWQFFPTPCCWERLGGRRAQVSEKAGGY